MDGRAVTRFPRARKSHLETERPTAVAVGPALRLVTAKRPLVSMLTQSHGLQGFDHGVVLETKLWAAKEYAALPHSCNLPAHGAVSTASPLSVLPGS